MSLLRFFDWIPTIPEVFARVECLFVDHEWAKFSSDDEVIILCKNCGKEKP